jgi:cytochrome c-type biogenesis protein CcmH
MTRSALLWFLLAIVSPTPGVAQTALPPAPYADTQLEDARLEQQAHDLMLTIRCVTCQSQSIADSNASMASDLRSEIRTRIKAGERPEAIQAWLIDRYGDWISYAPSADPILWPLWAAPVVFLLVGGILVAGRLRKGTRS